jgi:hypothetical protein
MLYVISLLISYLFFLSHLANVFKNVSLCALYLWKPEILFLIIEAE